MKALITVKNRNHARAIRRAIEDETIYAFLVTMGTLAQLPTDQAKRRVLAFIADKFREEQEHSMET